MLWFRCIMIQSEPAMSKKTISTPKSVIERYKTAVGE